MGANRSTVRYRTKTRDDEAKLVAAIPFTPAPGQPLPRPSTCHHVRPGTAARWLLLAAYNQNWSALVSGSRGLHETLGDSALVSKAGPGTAWGEKDSDARKRAMRAQEGYARAGGLGGPTSRLLPLVSCAIRLEASLMSLLASSSPQPQGGAWPAWGRRVSTGSMLAACSIPGVACVDETSSKRQLPPSHPSRRWFICAGSR